MKPIGSMARGVEGKGVESGNESASEKVGK
jgi:hypothetical protein